MNERLHISGQSLPSVRFPRKSSSSFDRKELTRRGQKLQRSKARNLHYHPSLGGLGRQENFVCRAESISFPSHSGGVRKDRNFEDKSWQQNSSDSRSRRTATKSEAHKPRSSPPVRKTKTKPEKGESVSSSLFVDFGNLPPDGKSVTTEEETCDPMEQRCKTAVHVWEQQCKKCYGSGIITLGSRRGGRHSCTCLACHGLGYVRQASSERIPDLDNGAWTLARSKMDD